MNDSDRLNILYLVRTWAFGGSHTIVLHLLEHLPQDRFRIVCVPYDTRSGADEAFIEQAKKRGLPVADERIPWRSRLNWTRARQTVSELIERHQIDLVHTHDPHSNVLVGLGRQRWPVPCVASAYGWWSGLFPIRRCINIWIERTFALPHFDRVITVSNHMKGKIIEGPTPEDQIRVIHTGLDVARLRTDEATRDGTRIDTRNKLGIPENACVIGTLSRVSVEKGHARLLEAAAQLASTHPDMHVLILGTGPAKADLENLTARLGLEGRVTFTGFYDDLPGALSAMDLLAQPSILEEGFPTSVLEAQLAGLPVVASDIGGTAETMDVPSTGLVVPPGDVPALADALSSLIADPERRAAMGKAARQFVEQTFTLENMVAQVCATYHEAMETCKP